MHGKKGSLVELDTVVGAAPELFNSDCVVTLTIGKSVLQPIEPTVGKKGPLSQPCFQGFDAD
ncbi:hypothetical protein BLL42_02705 [Pseudomonas frederiksbergensis]|uniref:Uncharacterized protein n=1 Tax=Pseudomonas frederiksbergensis TaxID=104087 RepID=A0A1J0EFU3_9PSED|nr:hypothetical protein BLL42_02705 [Pseudomonas frederiksbergensis]